METNNFQDWLMANEDVAVPGVPAAQPIVQQPMSKVGKDQIIQYWTSLPPSGRIDMQPMKPDHKGSTYSQDGIRITGSRQFIDSVIGRLKDLVGYENATNKLELVYKKIDSQHPETMRPESFVFYVMSKQRAPKVPRAKKITPQIPGLKKMPKMTTD